jgi:hypothetical protein
LKGEAMNSSPAPALLFLLCALATGCSESTQADYLPQPPAREKRFDELLAKHAGLTFEELSAQTPQRSYVEQLSFDPRKAKFYDETVKTLQLTDAEQEMLRKQGLVSVDHGQRYSFGSMYFAIYSGDLPVLVTTDSILHAMHRSYDDLLMEMEQTFLTAALEEILAKCHNLIDDSAPRWGAVARNYEDVDLYLTVARNLLKGAGAPTAERMHPGQDAWDGTLLVPSHLDQDEARGRSSAWCNRSRCSSWWRVRRPRSTADRGRSTTRSSSRVVTTRNRPPCRVTFGP